jgi:hypothetical protein
MTETMSHLQEEFQHWTELMKLSIYYTKINVDLHQKSNKNSSDQKIQNVAHLHDVITENSYISTTILVCDKLT